MARVVQFDTDEEIGYFIDLHGPLPMNEGWFLDAWQDADGNLLYHPPRGTFAFRIRLNMPIEHPERTDCAILVTPTYLEFMRGHPSFRSLPRRRR